MDRNNPYYRQVQLLVQILPLVAREESFALKGGTAINLFVRDFPRLSVDIDLVYLPRDERAGALEAISAPLDRIADAVTQKLQGTQITKSYEDKSDALRLIIHRNSSTVKLELSPVLRGTLYEPVVMQVVPVVEEEFGFVEAPVVAFEDLFAGKLCAALDRQHPRDLFDARWLLENEGLTERLRKAFLVYLISHSRPMEELIEPHFKDLAPLYEEEFRGMTLTEVPLVELEETRVRLVETITSSLTNDEKRFLCSIYELEPDEGLLGLDGAMALPAVRWKHLNVRRMPMAKREAALAKLKEVLDMESSNSK